MLRVPNDVALLNGRAQLLWQDWPTVEHPGKVALISPDVFAAQLTVIRFLEKSSWNLHWDCSKVWQGDCLALFRWPDKRVEAAIPVIKLYVVVERRFEALSLLACDSLGEAAEMCRRARAGRAINVPSPAESKPVPRKVE